MGNTRLSIRDSRRKLLSWWSNILPEKPVAELESGSRRSTPSGEGYHPCVPVRRLSVHSGLPRCSCSPVLSNVRRASCTAKASDSRTTKEDNETDAGGVSHVVLSSTQS